MREVADMQRLGLESRYVYGPIASRRLGLSLGLNISPTRVKHCSFGCIYCERGITRVFAGSPQDDPALMPPANEILNEVADWLRHHAKAGEPIASITFAGNGEPTDHPDFGKIVDGVRRLRDDFMGGAEIALLSNSHGVGDAKIRAAIMRCDRRCMKLDAGDETLWRRINVPYGVTFEQVIEGLRQLEGITIQSMILRGRVDNSTPEAVETLARRIALIQPESVHLYTLARAAPLPRVEKVPRARLEEIARTIRDGSGVPVEVFA